MRPIYPFLFLIFLLLTIAVPAQQLANPILLWPNGAPGATGATPGFNLIGITLDDADFLKRQSQTLVYDLAVCGLMPLTVTHTADQ